MPRTLAREDDKFFYYTDGGKTAKSQLTPGKREAMSAEIEKNRLAASAPQSADPFEAASFEPIADASQLSRSTPQMSLAPTQNVLGVPVHTQAPGMVTAPAPMVQPAGTMDMTPYNAPIPKTVVTTESVSGVPFSKEQQTALTKSFDRQIKATEDFAKAQGQAQVELAKINEDTQRSLDMIGYERSLIEEKKQQAINEFDAKYQDTINQIQQANVDPERFYGGSVGKRVLAGISIALGAMGSAFTGQRNYALDIINKAIDDDIAAQKEGIQKLGAQASLQRQFMQDIRQRFQDEDQAQLAQKAALIETTQMKIKQITDRVSNEQQKMAGEQLIGQLEAQKIDALSKGQQLAAGKEITRTQREFGGERASPAEAVRAAAPLRKEYSDSPVTKMTIGRRESFNTMQATAEQDSASGDISFIYAYMKMNDPTSTVREGEFATAQNAAGIPEAIRNMYNKALSGTRLSKEQKASFLKTAGGIYERQLKEQDKENARFSKLASRSGFDPQDVVIEFREQQPEQISQTFKPKAQPAANQPQSQIMRGR